MTPLLSLDPDQLLTTTRAVRKRLDLDRPVPLEVVKECLEVAVQAPTGSNRQGWHFIVVTDPAKRTELAAIYRKAFDAYVGGDAPAPATVGDPRQDASNLGVASSGRYLAEHLAEVPVLVVACLHGRIDEAPAWHAASRLGSVFPAVWSLCLAARARGLGTVITTLHLRHEREAAEALGIPFDKIGQVAMVPMAYTVGTDFKPAARRDLDAVVHFDRW